MRAREAEQAECDVSHHSTPVSVSNRSSQQTSPEERRHYQSVTATYRNWNMRGAETNTVCYIEAVSPTEVLSCTYFLNVL